MRSLKSSRTVKTPVLDARPGDGNVWTIDVSKAFIERIKSEAKRLAVPTPYASGSVSE